MTARLPDPGLGEASREVDSLEVLNGIVSMSMKYGSRNLWMSVVAYWPGKDVRSLELAPQVLDVLETRGTGTAERCEYGVSTR